MGYKFNFIADTNLPKLAWIAVITKGESLIKVIHGRAVECKENWMVEGVWDDDFENGNFHQSENFFGTGIRIEGDKIYFVTTFSPVDRLLYCEHRNNFLFSNSLILLLAYTGAALDFNHDYQQEYLSAGKGIDKYNREFKILHPEIKCFYQVFRENIIFSNEKLSFHHRHKEHKLESFDHYYRSIIDILNKIRKNYESSQRKAPITSFTTLSEGYDSTAVSCIVKNIGVKSAFIGNRLKSTIPFQKTAMEMDNAVVNASKLGYNIINLDNSRSRISEDELYFLSTTYPKYHSGAWSELGLHSMASFIEKNCSMAVVFSGHHGDDVWNVNLTQEYIKKVAVPHTVMGYCSEMRLKSGFVYVLISTFRVTNIKDIVSISRSEEMRPWRLNNTYDRPIPRRIAEEAGLDRHCFGILKKHIATTYTLPVNRQLRKKFLIYLKKEHCIPKITIYIEYLLNLLSKMSLFEKLIKRNLLNSGKAENLILKKNVDLYFLMCIWATNYLSEKTGLILSKHKAEGVK